MLRNLRRTRGAAIEAERVPRLWPGVVRESLEMLQATEVTVLNSEVFRYPRSRSTAAGLTEDRPPRKGAQQQRYLLRHPPASRPMLVLGKSQRVVSNVLGRKPAEVCRRERKAPLLSQLPTFCDPSAIRSKGREVKRRTPRLTVRRWSSCRRMATLISDGAMSGRIRSEASFLQSLVIRGSCCARPTTGPAHSRGPKIRGTNTEVLP